MSDFDCYSIGPLCASVCTNLPDKEATERLNETHPTGVSFKWKISADKTFSGGQPHPCPCPDHAGNRHILFTC